MTTREEALACPICHGFVWVLPAGRWVPTRRTVGMVCPRCGWDYSRGEPEDEPKR